MHGVVPLTGSWLQKAKWQYQDTCADEMRHANVRRVCSARETECCGGGMRCETEAGSETLRLNEGGAGLRPGDARTACLWQSVCRLVTLLFL
eukprot:84043-Pleurochrysis_carterae.AAC.1